MFLFWAQSVIWLFKIISCPMLVILKLKKRPHCYCLCCSFDKHNISVQSKFSHQNHFISNHAWRHLRDVFTSTACKVFSFQTPLDVHAAKPFSPSGVFRCQRDVLSFIFICCSYRAAGRYWWGLFVLCPHFWGTSRVVSTINSITHRDDDRPTTAEMHEWWAQIIHCTHNFLPAKKELNLFFFFLLLPPSPLLVLAVLMYKCTWLPGHSQALKSKHILHQQQDIIIYH